jgi:hypothetical protein
VCSCCFVRYLAIAEFALHFQFLAVTSRKYDFGLVLCSLFCKGLVYSLLNDAASNTLLKA